jgi:LysR family transcriptional regulator, glycine cleavage system transcriptional activator
MVSHDGHETTSCVEGHGVTRLPSLNALRAFEAAARHLSFTRAAAELNVTQTAISHQIRGLEERLGVQLFRRLPRGLLLTEEAQRYAPALRAAFEQIATATEELSASGSGGVLTLSTVPSFAAKWLVPRLGRFRAAHPEIDLRISASLRAVDFAREDFDAAIRMGRGNYPGLRVDALFGEVMFPVCSPRLLAGPKPLSRPEDLRHHVLLHDVDASISAFAAPPQAWRLWLERAGVQGIDVQRGPVFEDSAMLLDAAAEGQGVALGRSALVVADLAAGRLVQPFDISLPFALTHYLVCPEATADRPKIAAFRAWLLAEARAQEQASGSQVDRLRDNP